MGLFSKLMNPEKDNEFDKNYNLLKELEAQFYPYSSFPYYISYKYFDKVYPLTDKFISIAEQIDEKKAFSRLKKEAKAMHPLDRYPFHDDFHICVFDNDSWKRVVSDVRSIRSKLLREHRSIESFISKYSEIPSAEIKLSDEFIKRNKVIDMPEIKFAPVSKSFNKDKLVKFIVIDTETTGLKASNCRIIQLSAVKYVEFEPVEVWNTLINPLREIPKEASTINGKTDEMVKDKATIKQVAKSFIDFIGDLDVIGYNLAFDMKFLFAEGIDLMKTKRKYYDVYMLSKKAFKKDLDKFKLTDVAEYCGIYFPAHDSLNDCFATGELFEKIIDEIAEK